MGDWLRAYGQTIYGTRGGPWKPTKSIASTRKGNTIYLHLLDWKGETLTLPNIPRKILRSSVLTGGTARVSQAANNLSIRVSAPVTRPPDRGAELLLPQSFKHSSPSQIDCIVKLELDGSAVDLDPL
jgi:alpha-L-fucosidase